MTRSRYNSIPDYSPNQVIKTVGYQPQSDPALQQMLARNLEDMQKRYDATSSSIAETEGRIGELFPYDDAYKQEVLGNFKGKIDEVAKQYGYDYGAAANKITRVIGEEIGNKAYSLAREKTKNVELARQMKAQYGQNAIILNDPLSVPLTGDTRMEDLQVNILQAPDYQKVIREAAIGLEADIKSLGLSTDPRFASLLRYGTIADNNTKIDALMKDPAFHELVRIKAGTMGVDNRSIVGYNPETGENIFSTEEGITNYIGAALSPLRQRVEQYKWMDNPGYVAPSSGGEQPLGMPPNPELIPAGNIPITNGKRDYKKDAQRLQSLWGKRGKTPEEKAELRQLQADFYEARSDYFESEQGSIDIMQIPKIESYSFFHANRGNPIKPDGQKGLFAGVSGDNKLIGESMINSVISDFAINKYQDPQASLPLEILSVIMSPKNSAFFNQASLNTPESKESFMKQVARPIQGKVKKWNDDINSKLNETQGVKSGGLSATIYAPGYGTPHFNNIKGFVLQNQSKMITADVKDSKAGEDALTFFNKAGDIQEVKLISSMDSPMEFQVTKKGASTWTKKFKMLVEDDQYLNIVKDIALQSNTPELFVNQAAYFIKNNISKAPSIENKFGYESERKFKINTGSKVVERSAKLVRVSDAIGDPDLAMFDERFQIANVFIKGKPYYILSSIDRGDEHYDVFDNPAGLLNYTYRVAQNFVLANMNTGYISPEVGNSLLMDFRNKTLPDQIINYKISDLSTPKQQQEYYRGRR